MIANGLSLGEFQALQNSVCGQCKEGSVLKSKKVKVSAWFLVALSAVMMLISMIGTHLVESDFGGAKIVDYNVTLQEVAEMIRANNAETGKDIQVDFTEDSQYNFHFRVYIPKEATSDNPVPGVVCAHGGDNTLELQMPFYAELVRRGYVVISMDMAGHGRSDASIDGLTSGSYGMLAAAEYLMSLPNVDKDAIGLTGHSMGNLCSMNTIAVLNTPDSEQRIDTWVCGDGTKYILSLTPEQAQGMTVTVNVGKHSEMDILYVGGYRFLEGDLAKSIIKVFYPAFSDATVAEGQWYGSNGPLDAPAPGASLDQDAVRIFNNPNTHPGWFFSLKCTPIALSGFYAGLGVPSGSEYIAPTNQIWPLGVAFELLGLFGFFLLLFPLVKLLISLPCFRSVRGEALPRESYPVFKQWTQIIPDALLLVVFVVFSFYSYIELFPLASRLFDANAYPDNIANSIGFWTAVCGAFTLVMLIVYYLAQLLLNRKSGQVVRNPFSVAQVSSVSWLLKTFLFSVCVVIIMYIPVIFAEAVFKADFRIAMLVVKSGDLNKLWTIALRYLPMWLLFYIPNAIFNANTRFKDVPDWVTTLVCAVANCLPLILMIVIQYSSIVTQGVVPYPTMTAGGINAFCIAPTAAFSAFSGRYIYKKTGNVWAAGFINAMIFCLMITYSTWWTNDLTFF